MIDAWWTLAASDPVGHVTDKPWWGSWVFSNVTFMLLVSAVLTVLIVIKAAKRITTGEARTIDDFRAQGILANMIEAVCVYLRDQVFRSMLGDDTDRYTPMLWTFFWFILICNLMGLVPLVDITAAMGLNPYQGHYAGIGGTATQSIWVTGALATISFLWYNGIALRKDPAGFFKHLTGGAPVFMWPVMVVVEIIGMFVKPFALALRLFANMTGGHIIVATLLSFVTALGAWKMGIGQGLGLLPLLGMVAVYLLEILVAFIQAYIFTFLSALFLAQLVAHHDHDHGHGDDEAHGHEQEHAETALETEPAAVAP